jgi:hypothetical protein
MVKLRPVLVLAVAAACGFLLAATVAAVASTNETVSPRDNCGGFNGHVVWSGPTSPYIQIYGEVWDNRCPGSTSVWLSWDSPAYHNVEAQSATEPQTQGVNYKTGTSEGPENIKVAVCSTNGGWHCGDPVNVSPSGAPPPTVTVTTPGPVVTVPVTVPVPRPAPRPRALRTELTMSWTFDRAITKLRKVKVGRFPVRTRLLVRCAGHGCPRPARAIATGPRGVHRVLRDMEGRRYWAGDRLLISLRAFGWRPERVEIEIRSGQVPKVRLLRS